MIYPTFIKRGDYIGITAPSDGVGKKIEHYEKALESLKENGFLIKETASVRNNRSPSSSATKRGKEFNQLVKDDEVKLILCASGGDFLMEMLDKVDYKAYLKNPKWFMGMSDPSTLLFTLTTKYDIATIYGHNVGTFDNPLKDRAYKTALAYMQGDLIKQESYDLYQTSFIDDNSPLAKVYYKTPNGDVDIKGRMIGGCVDALRDIVGTKYDGMKQFNTKYGDNIFFIDNFALTGEDLYHCLFLMKENDWFINTKAVLFSRTAFPNENHFKYQTALRKIFGHKMPLALDADIGHTDPRMTLINGALAHLVVKEGKGSLEFSLE